jgi:hypothetical protein
MVEIILDSDRAFVRDDRFTGIAAGDEGDSRLHEGKIILANIGICEKKTIGANILFACKKKGEGSCPFTLIRDGKYHPPIFM